MGEQTDGLLLEVEFTHRWYRTFLEQLRADGYDFRGFGRAPGEGEIALRHDVDLSVESALEVARIEADLGVQSTYFILLTSPLYNPMERETRERLNRIESLGHDVALHFSTHAYPELDRRPPAGAIESRVDEERSVLAGLGVSVPRTVSFHMPTDWLLGRDFEGFQSTYAPAYFEDVTYVADSSQRWREDPPSVDGAEGPLQILTHPGLWGKSDGDFEERVEQAIAASCRRTRRTARGEFVDGGRD